MDFNKLVQRVVSILKAPRTEWPVIAAEPTTVADLYKGYIAILAGIAAVLAFIKATAIGYGVGPLGTYRLGVGHALTSALVGFVLGLVMVYVMALVIDALAPTFGAQKDRLQALKTAAYAFTAGWVAQVGLLVPWIGMLILIAGAVYSIYLLYLALPITMKAPADRAAGYTAVVVVIAIVLGWVVTLVTGGIAGTAAMMSAGGGISSPGSESGFDEDSPLGQLEQWSERVEEASKNMEAAQKSGDQQAQSEALGQMMAAALGGRSAEALAPDRLKGFVPETLGGLPRRNLSSERSGVLGMQISQAQATYGDDAGRELRLEIADASGAGGLLALASWANVESESENGTSFERTRKVDGRIVHEQWDRGSNYGEYAVVLGERFVVKVQGNASDLDALKAAAGTIDMRTLEALRDEGVKQE